MQGIMPFIFVAVGGLIGSVCRYGLTLLLGSASPIMPSWGTLASNLAGCLIIGMVSQLGSETALLSPAARLFLATGFCGGFTTLSSLIYELVQMVRAGEWLYATLYLNGTVFGAITAFLIGVSVMKLLTKT